MNNLQDLICKAVDFMEYLNFENFKTENENMNFKYWAECVEAYDLLGCHMSDKSINEMHNFILAQI